MAYFILVGAELVSLRQKTRFGGLNTPSLADSNFLAVIPQIVSAAT
jgi:hypothetical protein